MQREDLKHCLIVSCQPVDDGPMDNATAVVGFALAALNSGATALRIDFVGTTLSGYVGGPVPTNLSLHFMYYRKALEPKAPIAGPGMTGPPPRSTSPKRSA